MSHLLRRHAPITSEGWELLDDEARERLTPGLAARRVVDFAGPLGWQYSATNLGRIEDADVSTLDGVQARRRRVLPLVELRAPFVLSREELRAADRGAEDVDLDPLDDAAQRMVVAENGAVFHGWPEAGVTGIIDGSPHDPIACQEVSGYPAHVARAIDLLRGIGVGGPYGLVLSREEHTRVVETSEHGGYPLLDHLRKILGGGPLVWAPGMRGGVVLSLRGGDFLFECGQDLAVGYDAHDIATVSLYLEESFSFRVAAPEAAVAIAVG